MGRRLFWLVLSLFVVFLFPAYGEVKSYPQRSVTYIMGFPPGGKADIQARGLLPYVEKYLGVSFTIQYTPGAGGRVGYTKIFRAKPDGYTIGYLAIPGAILGEFLAKTEYRTTEFTPIFNCFVTPQVMVVASDTYHNVEELIKAAKTKTLTNASTGHGTSSYLAAIVVVNGLGIMDAVRHVHFEGTPQALASVAGKHLDFSICPTTAAIPLVNAGKLKAILTIAEERDPAFPDVPIPKELGYKMTAMPAVDGIVGPPNLPPDRVHVLETAFLKAVKNKNFLEWAERSKMSVVVMDQKKLKEVIAAQIREAEKYRSLLLSEK